jgi:flagellar assembly protein FliH
MDLQPGEKALARSYASNNVRNATVFDDIGQVAERERRRLFGPEPEPPELQVLRAEAAEVAKKVISEGLAEAESMREKAQEEGYRSGFARGYEEGLQTGRNQAESEQAQFRSDMEALVSLIERERQRLWREAEPQIIAFVLEIARQIVKDEAQVNRDIILGIIRNALRRVVDTDHIRLRVNVSDLDTVRASREDIMAILDGIRHLEIVEDRRVEPGGCVVETESGIIDARIETQFNEIELALQQAMDQAA